MTTRMEKIYQAAMLSDAAYVTFDHEAYTNNGMWTNPTAISSVTLTALLGTISPKDVPFGEVEDGRNWTVGTC